jgi:hypothetical protein
VKVQNTRKSSNEAKHGTGVGVQSAKRLILKDFEVVEDFLTPSLGLI